LAEARKLTKSYCLALQDPGWHWDTEIRGLACRVYPSGKKSWYFQRTPHGQKSLGSIHEVSLEKARREAAAIKVAIRAGDNPLKKRRKIQQDTKARPTLAEAWEAFDNEYLARHTGEKHRAEANKAIRRNFLPQYGALEPKAIEKRDWLAFKRKHEVGRPHVMRQMRSYIGSFYKWMMEHDQFMDHVDVLPFFGRNDVKNVPRSRKLTNMADVARLYHALSDVEPAASALAVQFLLLSNRRGIEVRRMTHEQLDRGRSLWVIPAGQIKGGTEVRQPLTPRMIGLINKAERRGDFVFSNGGGMITLSHKFNERMIKAAGVPYISYHDIRRTISTGMEEIGIRHHVITLTEGHFDKGIEAHYQQAEKRPHDDMLDAYQRWEKTLAI
jgi:integrase